MSVLSFFIVFGLGEITGWLLYAPIQRWRGPRHAHQWSVWHVVTRVERLRGPLGITEGPYYYNERVCTECQWTELHRIESR